jgi:CMP-N-acetylneuraminic acid synthetase
MHSEGAGLVIPHWRAVDIDVDDDWKRGELLFQLLENKAEDAL